VKIELVGFSQGVSLRKKDETINYLDLQIDGGREFRLPISTEALQSLMEEIYGAEKTAAPEEDAPGEDLVQEQPPEEEPQIGTVFGEEEDDPLAISIPDEEAAPESEEEVPSI
jgi:hypothetical protein